MPSPRIGEVKRNERELEAVKTRSPAIPLGFNLPYNEKILSPTSLAASRREGRGFKH
jgi:hypothetical protein